MISRISLICGLFFLTSVASAQTDSNYHLRASLLTVGVGDEIYASFGHTAIRITDSVNGTDLAYNYGTFNGFEESFEWKFMRGKLLYYCSVEPFRGFMLTYVHEQRKVEEQQLFLSQSQIADLEHTLQVNLQEENKYYKYDFLFDNCATRIRDVFPRSLPGFQYSATDVVAHPITFRQIIDRYLHALRWERLGIDILLGSKVDKVMNNSDVMFLPDYLRDGMTGATVNGRAVSESPKVLLHAAPQPPADPNYPFFLMLGIAVLTIAGLTIPSLKPLGKIMSVLVLVISGLLGCLILFMWFGTDHQACRNNWNILWALPTNLFLLFSRRGKDRYAIIAIILLVISLLLHILKIQELPLAELWPFLLSLLCIYGMIYRKAAKV